MQPKITKHLGKVGDRKICLLFRKVPNEDHMCLVIYPDVMPAHWHDSIMGALESEKGQVSKDFADALHTSIFPDGRMILETLHNERMIKKIRTADVIMTPTHKDAIRLDELNKMLDKIEMGDEALKEMESLDSSRGLVDAQTKRTAEEDFKRNRTEQPVVSSNDLASNMLDQAKLMEQEAKRMISEASRLKKEAVKLHPGVSSSKKTVEKTSVTIDTQESTSNQTQVSEPIIADDTILTEDQG
jgi:hypothetical protein